MGCFFEYFKPFNVMLADSDLEIDGREYEVTEGNCRPSELFAGAGCVLRQGEPLGTLVGGPGFGCASSRGRFLQARIIIRSFEDCFLRIVQSRQDVFGDLLDQLGSPKRIG